MLLESSLLIAFLNTADPSGQTIYSSGIRDDGDYVYSAPPACISPLLNIIDPIVLSGGKSIPVGMYLVKPSCDETTLLFIEGHQVVCALPIVENIIVEDYKDTPVVTFEVLSGKIVFTYQIENILKKAVIQIRQDC